MGRQKVRMLAAAQHHRQEDDGYAPCGHGKLLKPEKWSGARPRCTPD